jgi:hypothetical protein
VIITIGNIECQINDNTQRDIITICNVFNISETDFLIDAVEAHLDFYLRQIDVLCALEIDSDVENKRSGVGDREYPDAEEVHVRAA